MSQGVRDSFNLLSNCRRLLNTSQNKQYQNWALACELFSVGITSAFAICRAAGIDPYGKTITLVPKAPPCAS